MAQESEAKPKQPISISEARSKREASPKIETTADELRQIFTEVVDERVTAEISRLKTSINRIMDHIDAVVRGEAEDSALRVTTDHSAVDLAVAGIELHSEDYYIHTTGDLADRLGVRIHDISKMVKQFDLRGDQKYHKAIRTGKTCEVHKYSDAALQMLEEVLEVGEYAVPTRSVSDSSNEVFISD